ncbi:50S ribosomal protein L15 [Candidatus Saccharibacteria bacterium]|nr:50S ribosomal protein L15 [Candidatus Saccharibacteria bacterium]MBI2285300.1 50S ribosomal protein L15 [Candidatus Saccharibacteria bacterium]
MKYNELVLSKQRKARRSGRGISAGRGRTAGRGTKGQGARKSGGVRPGFEGGQMPLYMRLPHLRGFKSHKSKAEVVYTGQLETIRKTVIDNQTLFEASLISNPYSNAKLILKGDLKSKKDVKLQAASSASQAALKKAGGSFTKINRLARPAKASDKIK